MMKGRRWLVAALVLVLAGAFGVQATSTVKLGRAHHLADVALPSLVLTLEVGSITGAALFVLTTRRANRVRAGLLVALAAGVGATGGVQQYGFLIGLPVAGVLLLMVDTIGGYWRERSADGPPSPRDERDVDAPASETRPLVESPVTVPMQVRPREASRGPVPGLPEPVSADRESIPAPPPDEPAPDMPADMPEVDHEPEPTRLHAVPRRRNRDELERAGRALPDDLVVRRKAGESVESLRGRVEEAEEQARRRARLNA